MIFQRSDSFHIQDGASKKCVYVYVNGNFDDGRKLYVEPEWSMRDFLQASSQRLDTGTIASRVFNSDGAELDDPMLMDDNGMVFVSEGEAFIMPVMRALSSKATEKPSEDENMPSLVGGYQVGSLLGKGGFGEVRVGSHQLTSEQVALKFLKKSEIMSMGAAERTVTEIQCLMAMKHNNIIRLYQHVESMHHYVLIFELMEGGDLWGYQRQLAEQRERDSPGASGLPPMALREEDARSVFQQIVAGIAYAHNQHICHRDLKLENILLKNKNLEIVKIADFGLSAFYRPGSTVLTNCGTLSFLAPEVFKGTSNAGPPLDVWALGVILFSMLCGRLPFEGTDLSYSKRPRTPVIRSRILKCQYKIDESLSPEVKDLVRRMLRLDPGERATVPEIFNHFWLRGASSTVTELKRERSASNLAPAIVAGNIAAGNTVFASLSSAKEASLSRESSARSTDPSRSSTPRLSPRAETKLPINSDSLTLILQTLNGDVGVNTDESLENTTSLPSVSADGSSPPAAQGSKLVPLRRNNESNFNIGGAKDIANDSTTRRARAMLSDESDSLRDLTESISIRKNGEILAGGLRDSSNRFTRAKSQPANSLPPDFAGNTIYRDDSRRLHPPPYKIDGDRGGTPSHHSSPKSSGRGSHTFFSAGNASLNTHLGQGVAATTKRTALNDNSSNGRSPVR